MSDFAVIIAIVSMSGVDFAMGLRTPKLKVPAKFEPTLPDKRAWLVPPFGRNPYWTLPAAVLPALLGTILIFMDQQITAVIVNRKEHKLKVNLAKAARAAEVSSVEFVLIYRKGVVITSTCSCWRF